MQSCDVFHTQHAIFFATFDTCVYKREKRNTQLCKPKHHNFAMSKHIDVIHDWWALVVSMSMRYKR